MRVHVCSCVYALSVCVCVCVNTKVMGKKTEKPKVWLTTFVALYMSQTNFWFCGLSTKVFMAEEPYDLVI